MFNGKILKKIIYLVTMPLYVNKEKLWGLAKKRQRAINKQKKIPHIGG